MRDSYECFGCNGTEFYLQEPTFLTPTDRSWLFRPPDGPVCGSESAPSEASLSSSRRRRHRRRQRGRFDPPGQLHESFEVAESEAMTHDPIVEPDEPSRRSFSASPVKPRPHQRDLSSRSHPGDSAGSMRHNNRAASSGRPDSSTSHGRDGRLLSALRQLVSDKRSEDEWDPAKGPAKGIRWRGGTPPQPPSWSYDKEDLMAYNKYVKKVEIWLLQVAPYMSRKEAALQLYGALAGEPEAELEHCPVSEIYCDDGVEKILEALRTPMEQKQVYQKRKFLHEFENIRRSHGETLRSYCNRFRRTQRALRSVGIEITYTYDQEALGARLLDRSGLSHEQQRLLLVSTGTEI